MRGQGQMQIAAGRLATGEWSRITLKGDRDIRRGAFFGEASEMPGGGSRPTGDELKAEFTACPAVTPD